MIHLFPGGDAAYFHAKELSFTNYIISADAQKRIIDDNVSTINKDIQSYKKTAHRVLQVALYCLLNLTLFATPVIICISTSYIPFSAMLLFPLVTFLTIHSLLLMKNGVILWREKRKCLLHCIDQLNTYIQNTGALYRTASYTFHPKNPVGSIKVHNPKNIDETMHVTIEYAQQVYLTSIPPTIGYLHATPYQVIFKDKVTTEYLNSVAIKEPWYRLAMKLYCKRTPEQSFQNEILAIVRFVQKEFTILNNKITCDADEEEFYKLDNGGIFCPSLNINTSRLTWLLKTPLEIAEYLKKKFPVGILDDLNDCNVEFDISRDNP